MLRVLLHLRDKCKLDGSDTTASAKPPAEQTLDLPPTRHVYMEFYGEYAELTTRTQEFCGCLDHYLIYKGFDKPNDNRSIADVLRMPGLEECKERGFWSPSATEPSDHLMQSATFRL